MIENAGIADEDVERAWRLTRAAYDDPEFEGLEIDDTRAIIDISGRHVHVAFRGTATPLNAARFALPDQAVVLRVRPWLSPATAAAWEAAAPTRRRHYSR